MISANDILEALSVKTLKGTKIKRYKNKVGKQVGSQVYVHKKYVNDVVPKLVFDRAINILDTEYPGFMYNSIMYDKKKGSVRFDEAPDFDIAREPIVGNYVTVNSDGSLKSGSSSMVWHHKWLWVKDDYRGFDVEVSRQWSIEWLAKVSEIAKGNKVGFHNQLIKYGVL
jgi:hypothetical protein